MVTQSDQYNIENAKSQMRKGFLEFPVLLIIGTKPSYAPDILKELKRANLLVVEGTLYPLLSRLKRYGLVDYIWEESRSGPPRKIYAITPTGQQALTDLAASWHELDESINTLIRKQQPTT